MLRKTTPFAIATLLAACAPATVESDSRAAPPEFDAPQSAKWVEPDYPPTRILDPDMAAELRGASGITLQWISWDWRGQVYIRQPGETILINAAQNSDDAPDSTKDLADGHVSMRGHVEEVGADYFIFDGTITISDAPDEGRFCVREGPMMFRVTQGRRYWRLQDMEACGDGLTDYVDIYF